MQEIRLDVWIKRARTRLLNVKLLSFCSPTRTEGMTSITRNLPWFVKDLGVSIIGQVSLSFACDFGSRLTQYSRLLRNVILLSSRILT